MISAFDIGGSKIAAAGVSDSLELTGISTVPTPTENYPALLETMEGAVSPDAAVVGVSIAGLVNETRGTVRAANIPCLAGRSLATDLNRRTGRPVHLINDAKAFALAEAHCGAAAGRSSVFAVILGTGFGGAIVLDGKILPGASGIAGEWAHSPASAMRTGTVLPRWRCGCGQMGCTDVYGGARGLERLFGHLTGRTASSFDILGAWQRGEPEALETIDLYLDVLGGALAGTINLLDPDIVVLGGGLSGDLALVTAIGQEVRARILGADSPPEFAVAQAGQYGALLGAAVYVRSIC